MANQLRRDITRIDTANLHALVDIIRAEIAANVAEHMGAEKIEVDSLFCRYIARARAEITRRDS